MLYWAQNGEALQVGAWWWFVPPGLCIALVGTALALVNFGIDEFVNPRLRTAGVGTREAARELRRQPATAGARPAAPAPVSQTAFTPVNRPPAGEGERAADD
jgi:hypothetical protein